MIEIPLRILRISSRNAFLLAVALTALAVTVLPQQSGGAPAIVQPGAPGQPTKALPADTKAKLPPLSMKDVEFMQGMIVHHAQAVEMVALMAERTSNESLLRLGSRISHTQAEEIGFMRRWLLTRGEDAPDPLAPKKAMDHDAHAGHKMDMPGMKMDHGMMPGMLTPEQMEELAKVKGQDFDRLFLKGMIQHHIGALIMVKDLFDTAGAGQDAQIFNFATDVDSGQRAEIRVMQKMLEELTQENS